MGQRSQIYVRFNYGNKKYLIARYFQWNYGDHMISRARYTMDWLKEYKKYLDNPNIAKRLVQIIDTNFDYIDVMLSVDIIKEYTEGYYEDFSGVFNEQDNNDGQLLIDVTEEDIKYAFVQNLAQSISPLNPKEYMKWDYNDWEKSKYLDDELKEKCKINMEHILSNYRLMTRSEVEEFVSYDYVKDMELQILEDMELL